MSLTTIRRTLKKRNTVFTYKCTNCRTKNKTETPPEDSMLHCSSCGFITVQAFDYVEARLK